ncbi:hypothetical protein BDR26DRAFT_898188 [Obelidium mucronatum]|nr:hypothetical protein BDR26DRAFT_898188 [Obelidium mucronatum]
MCTDYCSSSTILTSSNTSSSSLYVFFSHVQSVNSIFTCCTCSNTPETLLFSASQVNKSLCGSQTLCETSVCGGGGSATNSFYPLYYLNTGNNSNNTPVIPPAWITSTEASPFQFRNQVRVGALAVLVALSSGTFLYFLYFSFHVEEAVVGKKEEGSRVSGNAWWW